MVYMPQRAVNAPVAAASFSSKAGIPALRRRTFLLESALE
jgi:hypothetical protein